MHYIYGALVAVGALVALLYVVIGVGVAAATRTPAGELFGGIFAIFGLIIGVVIADQGASSCSTPAICLGKRRHHTLCLVVAVLSCLMIPFGTLLGVFTLVVLSRPTVKQLAFARRLAVPRKEKIARKLERISRLLAPDG